LILKRATTNMGGAWSNVWSKIKAHLLGLTFHSPQKLLCPTQNSNFSPLHLILGIWEQHTFSFMAKKGPWCDSLKSSNIIYLIMTIHMLTIVAQNLSSNERGFLIQNMNR